MQEEQLHHLKTLQETVIDYTDLSELTELLEESTVLPHKLLKVSAIIIAVGIFVLQ
jgi:hypothetical protein